MKPKKLSNYFWICSSAFILFSMQQNVSAATQTEAPFSLENEFIQVNFNYSDGKIHPNSVRNKVTNEERNTIQFNETSEGFKIKLLQPQVDKGWTVTVDSESYNEGPQHRKESMIDGNPSTYWHSNYKPGAQNGVGKIKSLPYEVIIRFDKPKNIKRFMYMPRSPITGNGNVLGYEFYTKVEGQDFVLAKSGNLNYDSVKEVWETLSEEKQNVIEVKFKIISTKNSNPFGAIAEFDVSDLTQEQSDEQQRIKDQEAEAARQRGDLPDLISARNLTVANVDKTETDSDTTVTVSYQPVTKFNVPFTIRQVYKLGKTDHFYRTYLEISTPEENRDDVRIDTIDLQNLKVDEIQDVLWKLPAQTNIGEMGNFNAFYAGLGQPVYLKGAFYTGSEFPLAHNNVENQGTLFSRYYSGKHLAEQSLTEDGYYRTWPVVLGAARNNKFEVIQQDFYAYLRQIGTETTFRKQYNSWFDFMKNFDAEKIQHSFKEIDEGFTSYGVAPLDSYVVDDGWQNINSVWDVKLTAFPNKLYDSSRDVKRLGGDFGLWLGPQGGYGETTGPMARAVIANGKGSANGGVINVGDKRYVDYLKTLMTSYQDEFDINYWKLDGMLRHPLAQSTPNYIGGGYLNMYSMTETHERWIDLYKTLRQNRAGKDLWINLTSFINPSPWFLQWVNSIWMQNAGDVDYQDGVKAWKYRDNDFGSDAEEAITYRDDRYYEVVRTREWQLPFSNIYNHDPVYGITANSSKKDRALQPGTRDNRPQRPRINFDTDDFRDYLYMLGTRGTGFWEFYYSPSMMDDAKWQVNAEAVRWIEDNFEILRNAKVHGGKPGEAQVYGYSAWTKDEGIVSIRNPKWEAQPYTLTLDNAIGMYENTTGLYQKVVHGKVLHGSDKVFNYGDKIEINLEPYESVIFHFKKTRDEEGPKVVGSRAIANNKIEIEFDERIYDEGAVFKVAGTPVSAVLNPDLRTFTLTLNEALTDKQTIAVEYEQIKDVAKPSNESTGSENVTYYNGGHIIDIASVVPGEILPNTGINRNEEFTVSMKVHLTKYDQVLAEQKDQWKLFVDADGKVNFKVKDLIVKSAPFDKLREGDAGTPDKAIPLDANVSIKAVRYENGSIRLYIDGLVSNSSYDKEQAKLSLEKADVIVGTNEFGGTITDFKVTNTAVKYDAIKQEADEDKTLIKKVDVEKIEASSFNNNDGGQPRPAAKATDGDVNSYWASDPERNNITDPQFVTLEFNEPKKVVKVTYTPRQAGVVAVGTALQGKIETSLDGIKWTPFPQDTDGIATWNYTGEGGRVDLSPKEVISETPVLAKYVKFSAPKTAHWDKQKENTVVSAAEITAFAEKIVEKRLTFIYLENQIAGFENVNKDAYTSESYASVQEIVNRAKQAIADKENYTGDQESIDALYKEVKAAVEGLQPLPPKPSEEDKEDNTENNEQPSETNETDQPDKESDSSDLGNVPNHTDSNASESTLSNVPKPNVGWKMMEDNKMRFFKEDGSMANSEWIYDKAKNSWFYIKDGGQYAQNEWKGAYYLKSDGTMASNEWIFDENYNSWFYIKDGGQYAQNEWKGAYYLKSGGYMADSEWVFDEDYNNWFYIKDGGKYARNTWKGDYYLKSNGEMAHNEWVFDMKHLGWFYLHKNGKYARNEIINGYKVNEKGYWIPF